MLLSTCRCVCSPCCCLCIPRSIITVGLTPSVVILSVIDKLPALAAVDADNRRFGRASDDDDNDNDIPIGKPHLLLDRAPRTSTEPQRLCHAHRPYLSPSSSSFSSFSQNATLKVGVVRPPRNHTCTPPLLHRCYCHPTLRCCCHCCRPNLPAQRTATTSIVGINIVAVVVLPTAPTYAALAPTVAVAIERRRYSLPG